MAVNVVRAFFYINTKNDKQYACHFNFFIKRETIQFQFPQSYQVTKEQLLFCSVYHL